MSRKVYVKVETRLIIDMEYNIDLSEVVSEMDYHFNSTTDGAEILDTEIREYEVEDSK